MNRKYVIIVHGLMIKNGTVAAYGTEVTEGVEIDDAERKVAEGYLLSKSDFDKKVKEDEQAVADSTLSPEERSKKADQIKADARKLADQEKAKQDAQEKADKAHTDLLADYKKLFSSDAPDNANDDQIAKAIKDKIALTV